MWLGIVAYTFWDSDINLKMELIHMEEEYIRNKKVSVRESVLDFIHSIDVRYDTAEQVLQRTLRNQVEQIHSIAMNLYRQNAATMNKDTLEKLVVEAIRPIRFNNGRNYFFIRSMFGITKLWPPDPTQEEKSIYNNSNEDRLRLFNSMFAKVRHNGSGFHTYNWPKPGEDKDKLFKKIAYIKYFKPFDWYIGADDYLIEVEHDAQQHVTNIIAQHASRTDNEYMSILDLRSIKGGKTFATMLVDPNQPHSMNNFLDSIDEDTQGERFREKFLNGLKKDGEVFVKYKDQYKDEETGKYKVRTKMSYFKLYRKWSWIIARGFYFDDLTAQIDRRKEQHKKLFREKIKISFAIMCLLLLGSLSISLLFAYKVKNVSASIKDSINTQDIALPLIYLRHFKRENWKLKLILFLCTGIFFGLSWKYSQINLSILPFLLLALLSLSIVKERLVEYRIRKGFFGTNRTEAKALIEFIIKNSEDIDFTDSNGNIRRVLLPKAELNPAKQPLPTFGEEAFA
ncbi:hypothetical protein GKODMF_10655 [Candidatus Electrothrix gigas]